MSFNLYTKSLESCGNTIPNTSPLSPLLAASWGSQSNQPEGDSKIRNVMASITGTVNDVYNALEALEKRLDTVLTPIPPAAGEKGTGGPSPTQPQSFVLDNLLLTLNSLSYLVGRIHEIRARVEV